MAILDTSGKRISALLADTGMTQRALAIEAGLSEQHISDIVNDRVPRASAAVMALIAEALGSSVDYIMGLSDDPLPAPDAGRDVPEHIAKFNRLLEALPAHLQDAALDYLREQLRLFLSVTELEVRRDDETAR